jgi:hypothetical protein
MKLFVTIKLKMLVVQMNQSAICICICIIRNFSNLFRFKEGSRFLWLALRTHKNGQTNVCECQAKGRS